MEVQAKELTQLIRKEKNARMRLKLLALLHFHDGKSRYQIAAYLKVSRTSVNKWISSYLSHGLKGLKDKKHSGRPPFLTPEQESQLSVYVTKRLKKMDKDKISGPEIKAYISSAFGIDYEISSVYRILSRLGLS
ncbi:helix-turn-helix domain-containing protein [Shewanella sp. AS16]|uniref:helix-turn-helix domain-containing protein n=1 Tax=Shewanella sp. AS16 TaxID=2907625 RepID=UPI001F439173|nr:helix-turn-helix domain-containing protein [Shewanella sp. AS16]MCE9685385.1 helix-turn-helix domain-containing protein [Shewanella sp. AS16]